MRSVISLLSLSALLVPVQSLYFYIEGTTPKCFFEELPKDTLVVGHYDAEEFDEDRKTWSKHDQLNILITVDVCSSLIHTSLYLFPLKYNTQLHGHFIPGLEHSSIHSRTDSPSGSIRQRPPRRQPERLSLRTLHIQRRRLGRPQDLLHALLNSRQQRLALRPHAPRRRAPHPRPSYRRDLSDREHGQGQDPGHRQAR